MFCPVYPLSQESSLLFREKLLLTLFLTIFPREHYSPDYGTLHRPISGQHSQPPSVQHPAFLPPKESNHTVLKPVEIKEEHKELPLQSMYRYFLLQLLRALLFPNGNQTLAA